MFIEGTRSGLFEDNDIYYNAEYDDAFYNDAFPCIEAGASVIRKNHMGEGHHHHRTSSTYGSASSTRGSASSTRGSASSTRGSGIFDTLKALAPFAAKAVGTLGSHLLEGSKKKRELENEERKENQAQIRRMIQNETDPKVRAELLESLRI